MNDPWIGRYERWTHELSRRGRFAFAAFCAERALPAAFPAFEPAPAYAPGLFREALDRAWGAAEGKGIADVRHYRGQLAFACRALMAQAAAEMYRSAEAVRCAVTAGEHLRRAAEAAAHALRAVRRRAVEHCIHLAALEVLADLDEGLIGRRALSSLLVR